MSVSSYQRLCHAGRASLRYLLGLFRRRAWPREQHYSYFAKDGRR